MATRLDLADAQFLGYFHGAHDKNIIGIIEAMGLIKKEWKELKEKYDLYIDDKDMIEIEEYLKNQKV